MYMYRIFYLVNGIKYECEKNMNEKMILYVL